MRARAILNIVLALLLAVAAVVSWFLRADRAQPNAEFLPDMAHSPRYNAYSANPNFADNKTLQLPPEGAIARGYLPLNYTASSKDAVRAGEELTSPLQASEGVLQRGATVFANYCAVCHGADGKGMGPVAQRGYPPPPSLLAEHAVNMKDGQLFHILTFGQNSMPSYAAQISREDRWKVIAYVRSLQQQETKKDTRQIAAAPAAPVAGGQK
jgi:mono/diheme cytochrome c family protein